jgi:GTP-binding protein
VGKSSLFNRILARRQAIVSDVAGTTRDRLLSEVAWGGSKFILVDTGGLENNPDGQIRQMVQEQADMAMAEASLIIFLTDAMEGLTAADQEIAQRLRRSSKPVLLVVNKVDNDNREFSASEFYRLGLGCRLGRLGSQPRASKSNPAWGTFSQKIQRQLESSTMAPP